MAQKARLHFPPHALFNKWLGPRYAGPPYIYCGNAIRHGENTLSFGHNALWTKSIFWRIKLVSHDRKCHHQQLPQSQVGRNMPGVIREATKRTCASFSGPSRSSREHRQMAWQFTG